MAGKDKSEKAKKKGGVSLALRLSILIVLVAAGVFLPSTVLFLICMIPTLVAMLVDSHKQKTLWLTVGSMNLAGTIPAWFNLWEVGHHMAQTMSLISRPGTLLMAYGAAAIGWIIHFNVTPFVSGIMVGRGEKRLKVIDKRQKELVRRWGPDVTRLS